MQAENRLFVAALPGRSTRREIVDMPDRRASRFVRLCMQNGGQLSSTRRGDFPELDGAEIEAMETAIRQALLE